MAELLALLDSNVIVAAVAEAHELFPVSTYGTDLRL